MNRRALLKGTLALCGYFATRRVLPEPEEEPRTHVNTLAYDSEISVHFEGRVLLVPGDFATLQAAVDHIASMPYREE